LLVSIAALVRAEQIVDGSGRVLRQQIVWSVLGLGVMAMAALGLDYRRLRGYAPLIFAAAIAALAADDAFSPINGARRWSRVGGIGLQPSEFAKPAFIVAMAGYLAHRDLATRFVSVLAPMAITAVPMLLILKEPDLGTSIVFVPLLLAMLFVAGARSHNLL